MYTFSDVTAILQTLPPRFGLETAGPDFGPTLGELVSDPERRTAWLGADAARVGAPPGQVAVSMLVQHVAMLLGGSPFATALLGGVLPVGSVDTIRVAPGQTARWRFGLESPEIITGSEEELLTTWVDVWVDGVLMDVVDGLRRSVRVGSRLLRDNVATASASTLVFVDWWAPERGFAHLAPLLLAAGSPPLGDSFSWTRLAHDGHLGLGSVRRSCCMHDRCDPPHSCPGCPSLSAEERELNLRGHLAHLDGARARFANQQATK